MSDTEGSCPDASRQCEATLRLMAHLMAQSRHRPARCSSAGDLWGGTPLSFLFCRNVRQLLQVIALSDGDCPQVFIILNLSQFAISSLISESDSWNMNSAGKIELVGRHPAVVSVLPRYSSIIASYCPFRWGLSPSFQLFDHLDFPLRRHRRHYTIIPRSPSIRKTRQRE